jgi:hypothetical protein
VAKTCLQGQQQRVTLRKTMADIYRTNRVRGFYIGFIPHLMRTVPNASITLFLVETLREAYVRVVA